MADTVKTRIEAKVPPQSLEAESSLLGAILLDQDAIIKVSDRVHPDDFYEQRHQLIYKSIQQLYNDRRPIDVLTLSNQLDTSGDLEHIGGRAYLTELANSVPSAAHVEEYAKIVSHKATLRRLIAAASDIVKLGYDEEVALDKLLDKAEKTLFDVSAKQLRRNFVSISDVLAQSFDRLDELHKDDSKLRGIPTGFGAIDNLLAGLQKSDLIVLAARPAMGKTSLAMNMVHHVAVKEGIPVGVFSLEMSQEQLVDRLLAMQSGVDSWKLRTGKLDEDDFSRIGDAMGALSEAPIYIDDAPNVNIMEIRTVARRMQNEHGIGLLVIDYLQLMSGNSPDRVQEVSEISRGLKALARELNVPVLAISQLSRSVESRSPQVPMLADLRESGSIEQDADVVMFIYREEYYNSDTERQNIADILIQKHRNGPIGKVELYWHGEQLTFRSIDRGHATSHDDAEE